jgi:hypothetical protein
MNTTPQPPSSEEPEKQPSIQTSNETSTQTSPTSKAQSDESEQQTVYDTSDNIPWKLDSSAESGSDEIPIESGDDSATQSQAESATLSGDDATTQTQAESPTQNWDDASASPEDQTFASGQSVVPYSQPSQSGIFIHKGILIAAAGIVVVAAVLVGLLLFINRPKEPPTDWIASTGTSSTGGTILYYLHWTNQNGVLKGQLQLAANSNGTPQSVTDPTTGLYSNNNHVIYVIVTLNGQAPATLTGTINANNDTLTLNPAGATDQTNQIVFHVGSASAYKQATNKLNSSTKK